MTPDVLGQAAAMILDPYVLWVVVASAAFGLFVGAVPGLTATMATALLVPVTFFMPPMPVSMTLAAVERSVRAMRRCATTTPKPSSP